MNGTGRRYLSIETMAHPASLPERSSPHRWCSNVRSNTKRELPVNEETGVSLFVCETPLGAVW